MRAMPAALREDELRELRGHLEQRAEDYQNAGLSDDDGAIARAGKVWVRRARWARNCAMRGKASPWSWWRLAAAIAGVTAFLLVGVNFGADLGDCVATDERKQPRSCRKSCCCFARFYIALPLLCGVLFSHWLGRRGCIVATLYFAALALGNLTFILPASSNRVRAAPANFVAFINAAWFPYFWVALAFAGAWTGQNWRIKQRYQMALAGARLSPPSRFLWVPLNPKWWRNAALAPRNCRRALWRARLVSISSANAPHCHFEKLSLFSTAR